MKITVSQSAEQMALEAAKEAAGKLREAVRARGEARLVLSTGASQFAVLEQLVRQEAPWSRVEMFHLDEYVGLPKAHKASFRRYLRERFVDLVHPKAAFYVDGEAEPAEAIRFLTREIRRAPVDVALVGIGENAHIAFNDPPADFDTREAYVVVELEERCKRQQVGEGWFPDLNSVPGQAISMTVYQIMQSRAILSCVPGERKAAAVRDTLSSQAPTNAIPATMLRQHPDWRLFLDPDSASLTPPSLLKRHQG
ncbi:MAG: glucosamine-6-phosphate deaminase [Candidatus Limiplasma sp.]|nr:glucosamine-6-phosphate deaminase [Candidatus Limiplasma sp.]